MTVAALPPPDARSAPHCIIVVAGFDPWPQNDRRLKSWLRALDRHGIILGAVDTGCFLLASAGLLGGIPTTLHWESVAAFAELFPDVPLSDRLFELHPRRVLCAGGSAVLDMILEMMERDHGGGLCDAIATRLMHARRRPVAALKRPSDTTSRDGDVTQILEVMENHIEEPMRIADVAGLTAVSQRSLERKFRRAFGRTPKQVYLGVRLEKARQILRHSDLAVRDVALSCGFTSIPYFCRAYKALYHVPPGSDRTLDAQLVEDERTAANPGKRAADLGNEA
jgi:AraC family carnitine catabolism transcriptional activator